MTADTSKYANSTKCKTKENYPTTKRKLRKKRLGRAPSTYGCFARVPKSKLSITYSRCSISDGVMSGGWRTRGGPGRGVIRDVIKILFPHERLPVTILRSHTPKYLRVRPPPTRVRRRASARRPVSVDVVFVSI
ncbi:hypothetical protein EVAR_18650_1 [Eumeta japonica]|uniref:Uncharacterized protein n=1 Tax=Eumeta variegata TaxID=151549 RepID=A0A4C1U6R6_EUMVA|nr:hypothetical protein EVAR_18650_1 [Eumeta japonica]